MADGPDLANLAQSAHNFVGRTRVGDMRGAFVDVVESMGQTVGSALAWQFCSNYDLFVDVGAGFEAQVGPFVASKKVPIIPQKAFRLTQSPCPAS